MWTSHGYARHDVHVTTAEIEAARKRLGLSIRAAARLAGISEGRWRQIIAGSMRVGGVEVRVNPKASTLAAMEKAVQRVEPTPKRPMGVYSDRELVDELRDRLARLQEDETDAQSVAAPKKKHDPVVEAATFEDLSDPLPDSAPDPRSAPARQGRDLSQ